MGTEKELETESKNQQISISFPRIENIWTLTGFTCVQLLCSPTLVTVHFAKTQFCNSFFTNSLFLGPLDQGPILVELGP